MAIFSQFGPIKHLKIKKDPMGVPRGFAFVHFHTAVAAHLCVAASPVQVADRSVEIRISVPPNQVQQSRLTRRQCYLISCRQCVL
jgi:RNA recognition motif-containing protein